MRLRNHLGFFLMKEGFRHRLVQPVNLTIPCRLMQLETSAPDPRKIFLLDSLFLAV